jgi:hypothetical protein
MNDKKYGTEESKHLGICVECKEEKITRLYLSMETKECSVCDDCYLKDLNKEEVKKEMEIRSYTGHDGTEFYKISDGKTSITTQDNGTVDFGNWLLNLNNKSELQETLSLIIKAVVSLKNEKIDKKEG